MRRALVVACAAATIIACAPRPSSTSSSSAPTCATTFVNAITSPAPTPGVWDCLSTSYQTRVQGQGDSVFALDVPLWSRYRYIGQDRNIALFDMTVNGAVEPGVYDPPVTHVVIAVYLDGQGRVDHAKAATPSG